MAQLLVNRAVDARLPKARQLPAQPSSAVMRRVARSFTHARAKSLLGIVTLVLLFSLCARADTNQVATGTSHSSADQMPWLDVPPDPLEGFNRCSWALNTWIFRVLIYPLSRVYNVIAPRLARTALANAGHNLSYPVRLFNNSLQGKWHGAWEETKRFGANSTLGLGGLFDPATHWKMARSDEDFGQTMGHWGAGPGFYLVLPVFGPSSGRDALGKAVDVPFDPCFWLGVGYSDEIAAQVVRPGFTFNTTSGDASSFKRNLDSLVDPYETTRWLDSLNRQRLVADFTPNQNGQFNPNPSLRALAFKPQTPNFAERATSRHVQIAATGKRLSYSCWMQKKPSPMVCYLPGLGSYRLEESTLAYADLLYRHGYSVIAISNPFHKEFMDHASTIPVPGYAPADCDDLINALTLIIRDVRRWKGGEITSVSLSGVSHGAFLTLMIAAREATAGQDGLRFDRYVAINPPVELASAARRLDEMFDAPLAWPVQGRELRSKQTLYKALYFDSVSLNYSGPVPLTRTESDYLIGVVYRHTLTSAIADSQRRNDLGILQHDPKRFTRQELYREVRKISYAEYANQFVIPCLMRMGRVASPKQVEEDCDLKKLTPCLRNNSKIRVQICDDDFLISHQDVSWFKETFGPNLQEYPAGGHLGNLYVRSVQATLLKMFPPIAHE